MILLLNTATPICQLTLGAKSYQWSSGRDLADGLLKFIEDSLSEQAADWSNITSIGVFSGPGSFTGLRIGITVMNTIANANHLPIVGVSGENWQEEAVRRLENHENDKIVIPNYGSEANITKPRK